MPSPSDKDYTLQDRDEKVVGVVQALTPSGERQSFYYGLPLSRGER